MEKGYIFLIIAAFLFACFGFISLLAALNEQSPKEIEVIKWNHTTEIIYNNTCNVTETILKPVGCFCPTCDNITAYDTKQLIGAINRAKRCERALNRTYNHSLDQCLTDLERLNTTYWGIREILTEH